MAKELLKAYGLLILYLSPFVIATGYILFAWGKQNARDAKEYERLYNRIVSEIATAVSKDDIDAIRFDLKKLGSLRWGNREKTRFISMEFCKKFYSVKSDDRLCQDLKRVNQERVFDCNE